MLSYAFATSWVSPTGLSLSCQGGGPKLSLVRPLLDFKTKVWLVWATSWVGDKNFASFGNRLTTLTEGRKICWGFASAAKTSILKIGINFLYFIYLIFKTLIRLSILHYILLLFLIVSLSLYITIIHCFPSYLRYVKKN